MPGQWHYVPWGKGRVKNREPAEGLSRSMCSQTLILLTELSTALGICASPVHRHTDNYLPFKMCSGTTGTSITCSLLGMHNFNHHSRLNESVCVLIRFPGDCTQVKICNSLVHKTEPAVRERTLFSSTKQSELLSWWKQKANSRKEGKHISENKQIA